MSNSNVFPLCLFILLLTIAGCKPTLEISQNSYFKPRNSFSKELNQLVYKIDSVFCDTLFEHAHWGAIIKSLDTETVWYERNADKLFVPASNTKIPTAAAALLKLGPGFKFTTNVCTDGEVTDSILNGDLIIWGDGDPSLYHRLFDSPEYVFIHWADSLQRLGIKAINGNIIGDDNAFDEKSVGFGWSHEDITEWYGAEINSLSFNENCIDFCVYPSKEEKQIIIKPNIANTGFIIKNQILIGDTGEHKLKISRKRFTNNYLFDGYMNINGDTLHRSISVDNPTAFYVQILKNVLEEKGIKVSGKTYDCDKIENWNNEHDSLTVLIKHESPDLSQILSGMMKRSQNLYAETFVRTLGYHLQGEGSFEKGKEVVIAILDSLGIKENSYAFRDGSGLSRYNYFSPRQFMTIYEKMDKSVYSELWHSCQTIAGVDGTLKQRMSNTLAADNVHGKTGTMSYVRALSGYVTTKSGERLVFSFLVNGHLLSPKDTERITDEVLIRLAEFEK